MAVVSITGATLAWFTAESSPVTNEFTAGTVIITADETVSPPEHIVDNWNPGDCTEKEYTVINSGTKSIFMRVKLSGSWYNPDGTPFNPEPDLDVVTWGFCDDRPDQPWIRDGNTWYYEHILPGTHSGATLEERQAVLCLKICLDGPKTDNQYQGKVFILSAVFEAVQSSHGAVDQVWPDNPYSFNNPTLFHQAVFVNEDIKIDGSSRIEGTIGTNSVGENSIELGWSSFIDGDVYIGPGGDKNSVIVKPGQRTFGDLISGEIMELDTTRYYQLPDFPAGLPNRGVLTVGLWPHSDYHLESDAYYESLTIQSNGTLTIDTGTSHRVVRIGSFAPQQGHIVLEGSGRLLLYVDNFNDAGNIYINEAGPAGRLVMYVKDNSVNMGSGSSVFRGGLLAPDARVKLLGSSKIIGALVADSLDAGAGERVAVQFESVIP